MKRFWTLLLFILPSAFHPAFSQWQTIPSGTTKTLVDGCFVNDSTGFIISSDGTVLKSIDMGNTWVVNATLTGTFTSICHVGMDTLYVGGNCIYGSYDRGNSWNLKANLPDTITDLDFFTAQNGFSIFPGYEYCHYGVEIYTIPRFKLFKTQDYGVTWLQVFDNLEQESRMQVMNDSTAFFTGGYYNHYLHCFDQWFNSSKRTTSGGSSWASALQPYGGGSLFSFIDQDRGFYIDGWRSKIYKTLDGGTTLTSYYKDNLDTSIHQIKFLNEIDGYLLADHHIYVTSSNGLAWKDDYSSSTTLNRLFDNPASLLFGIGAQGLILKKQIVASLYPDTVYRLNSPDSFYFGNVQPGNIQISPFGLTNTGNIALPLSITAPDDFLISFTNSSFVNSLSDTILPSESKLVYVQFHPTEEKVYSGIISVASDSLETQNISVKGWGLYILTGNITRDTIVCSGNLRIGSDVTVDPGIKLTLCAGTLVSILGYYKMTVKGTIEALGDSLHPIEFETDTVWNWNWKGIALEHSNTNDTSIFNFCNIGVKCATYTLLLNNSKAKINRCSFTNNGSPYSLIHLYGHEAGLDIQNSTLFNSGDNGIECNESDSCFIRNCTFYETTCGVDISNGGSPGNPVAHSVILDNLFYNNIAGIDADGSVTIKENKIYNNKAGVRVSQGRTPLLIENNEIWNNTSGGIEILYNNADVYIVQNLIYNNSSAKNGAGLLLNDEYYHPQIAYVFNNTICNNKVTGGGSGSDFYSENNCILRNNIIFNISDTTNSIAWNQQITPDIDYNCLSRKGSGYSGSNNLFTAPVFVNPTSFSGAISGNIENAVWSLTPFSACINQGDTTLFPDLLPTDFAGYPRVIHDRIDMGAYEYQGPIGIHDGMGSFNCRVFPNPARDFLQVIVDDNSSCLINIYDVLSRKVLGQKFAGPTTVHIQHLQKGLYFYEVLNRDKILGNGKIIKE